MARQRFIWPDIWTDPAIGRMQPVEILFFIGCFSNADDEGRLMADPAYLRSTVFPYQDMRTDEVREVRDRVVAACPNLTCYRSGNREYLAFRKWSDYQKPKYPKPSKLPKPPGPKPRRSRSQSANPLPKASGKLSEALGEASGKASEGFPPWDGLGSTKDFKDQPPVPRGLGGPNGPGPDEPEHTSRELPADVTKAMP